VKGGGSIINNNTEGNRYITAAVIRENREDEKGKGKIAIPVKVARLGQHAEILQNRVLEIMLSESDRYAFEL